MRYLCLIKNSEKAQLGAPPDELFQAVEKVAADARAAGVLVEIGGPGTKEGGAWAVYDVRSMDEVVDWASRLLRVYRQAWPEWQGECQIRRVSRAEDVG